MAAWRRSAELLVLLLGLFGAFAVRADGVEPYEEIGKHLRAAQQVGPMSDGAFGDQINLYNGSTSFEAVDISIPGNNALPVQLARSFRSKTGHGIMAIWADSASGILMSRISMRWSRRTTDGF